MRKKLYRVPAAIDIVGCIHAYNLRIPTKQLSLLITAEGNAFYPAPLIPGARKIAAIAHQRFKIIPRLYAASI